MAKSESIDTLATSAAQTFKAYCAARKAFAAAQRAHDKAESDLRAARIAWERSNAAYLEATKEPL